MKANTLPPGTPLPEPEPDLSDMDQFHAMVADDRLAEIFLWLFVGGEPPSEREH
jgi:hypothetical protein